MFCRNCGMKVLMGVSTCPACGKPMGGSDQDNEPYKIHDPHNLNTNMVNYQDKNNSSKDGSKNYGILFVLIVLIILLVIALIRFFGNF